MTLWRDLTKNMDLKEGTWLSISFNVRLLSRNFSAS